MNMFLAFVRNRKWLKNCKNQKNAREAQTYIFHGLRVKERVMNQQKIPKMSCYLCFLIHGYFPFKYDFD